MLCQVETLIQKNLLTNKLLDPFKTSYLAAGPGFEPGLTDPESAVLPLDDPAILFI